jgi:flagellar protein FliS
MPASVVKAEQMKLRYLREAVITATPAVRLNMLFDRMLMDLRLADEGFEHKDFKAISDGLCNAQSILLALRGTLRTDLWDGARDLSQVYFTCYQELVQANLNKDRAQLRRVIPVVEDLAGAWRRASEQEAGQPRAAGVGA